MHRSQKARQPAMKQQPTPETWQLAERSRGRARTGKPANDAIIHDVDTNAENAWRAHTPPFCTIIIPPELVFAGGRQGYLQIARQAKVYVFPQEKAGKNVFGIWAGTREQANAARQALTEWIRRDSVSKHSLGVSSFTKVRPMTDQQRAKAERRWLREVNRHRFRQSPPSGSSFEAIGTFHWPIKQIKPEDALGNSLEALDPVRMDHCCFVIPIDNVIQVLGNTKDVQAAIVRLRGTFFQLIARQYRPARIYLTHWDDAQYQPQQISLDKHEHPVYARTNEPSRSGGVSYLVSQWDGAHGSAQPSQALEMINASLSNTLEALSYYNADICFRVRLGTFVATSYVQPKSGHHSFDDFESMIMQSQFAGTVTQEIGNLFIEEEALSVFQNASHLIEPNGFTTTDLKDVPPLFTVVFKFDLPDGDYQLTMGWQESFDNTVGNAVLVATPVKWAKLDSDTGLPIQLLDVNLMRLDGNFAWHFDMQATNTVSEQRLPSSLRLFASRVQLLTHVAREHVVDKPFVAFMADYDGLASVTCSVSYSYRFAQSGYVLGLSRFQRWEYSGLKVHHGQAEPKLLEPRWSLSIHHLDWEKMLGENGSLNVGERIKWSSHVDMWLPVDDQTAEDRSTGHGIHVLVDKMKQVEVMLLKEQMVVDESTGMCIG